MAQVEYGPSGPTQIKDISPPSGMSNEMAAFVAANASPFTNPRDMPAPAKVPDPRNTQDTDTTFIWARFEIPAHSDGALSSLVVTSSPDPLSPVPIWVSSTTATDVNAFVNPNSWAALYDSLNLRDFVAQCDSLAVRSKAYRVVGHGLKAWVSRAATVGTGNISAGQFDYASITGQAPTSMRQGTNTKANYWANPPGNASGYWGTAIQSRSSTHMRTMISQGKNEEIGFLAADEGATVRWTDKSDFPFKATKNLSCVRPLRHSVRTSGADRLQLLNLGPDGTVSSATSTDNCYAMPVYTADQVSLQPYVFNSTYTNFYTVCNPGSYNAAQEGLSFTVNAGSFFHTPATTKALSGSYTDTDPVFADYCSNAQKQFDTGLYIDVQQVQANQTVIVQVVWQIEYVPIGTESWSSSLPSPVDMDFDKYAVALRSRSAFPIVVKGHSFFSSLKKAIATVGRGIGKVFATAGAVGPVLAASGIPHLQAAGMALTAAGTVSSIAMQGANSIAAEMADYRAKRQREN